MPKIFIIKNKVLNIYITRNFIKTFAINDLTEK